MKTKWQPSAKDVEKLCDAILSHYIEEGSDSCDYCVYCGRRYGNVTTMYRKKGIREPHDPECPVLVAQDVSTGIED